MAKQQSKDILGDSLLIMDRRSAKMRAMEQAASVNILGVGGTDVREWQPARSVWQWVPLEDSPRINLEDFVLATKILDELVGAGSPVIVTCDAGESRSAAVVVGWLLPYRLDEMKALDEDSLQKAVDSPLFLETHRWFGDSTERHKLEVPKGLTIHPDFPCLRRAYLLLGAKYPRVICKPEMWERLLPYVCSKQS